MNSLSPLTTEDTNVQTPPSAWNAELSLQFARTARGSVLQRADHRGPLYVQKAFYPEGPDLAQVYLLHPPGGLVSGDRLDISVHTGNDSHALLTTPGAGRVYRARPDRALQHQINTLNLSPGSSIEWLPLETILYPDACTRLDTRVNLADNAHFIGWEITSLGLPNRALPFNDGQLSQTLQINRGERILLRERLQIDEQSRALLQGPAGLRGKPVTGLMVAGPFDVAVDENSEHVLEPLIKQLRQHAHDCDALAAVSLTGEFMTIRYLGDQTDTAMQLFVRCWHDIRPALLDRPACEPRIWAT
ncbi:urease accessory protein UreD [Amphritea sp. 1_MG-2023]|uniref:urease accessory protein UreD n=1 Tax=Amphritea sp. 1_MG-2023 TaxID=3062670 RepID=UPI0026E36BF0|nr:urease accessory protein UreD [Amphritea sp. 1_MG-2023]MDO6561981.1 urease accessory protein UreD [Amphritea sp. 1_MG-2023]